MNLLQRTRAAQHLCVRCGRHAPYPGILTCRDCTERLITSHVPEWTQRDLRRDFTVTGRAA